MGSWVYGMAPLDPDWIDEHERTVHRSIFGFHYVLLPSNLRDSADKGKRGWFRGRWQSLAMHRIVLEKNEYQ